MIYRTEPYTVTRIIRETNSGRLMVHGYEKWGKNKQSEFIESILMGIPIPVFYFMEDDNAMIVLDGWKRIHALKKFMDNKLKLRLFEGEFDGKKFEDLLPEFQNRIEDTVFIFYVIDYIANKETRLDVIERVMKFQNVYD